MTRASTERDLPRSRASPVIESVTGPASAGLSEQGAEIHAFERGAAKHVGRGAVERAAERFQHEAAALQRAIALDAEAAAVEPRRHVHPLDSALAVAELVEVEAGRHPCLRRRRAAAGEREATGERGGGRVARELAEVHAIDPALAQLVAERVAEGDEADGGDRPAAGEQLGAELEPPAREPERRVAERDAACRCPARRVRSTRPRAVAESAELPRPTSRKAMASAGSPILPVKARATAAVPGRRSAIPESR